VAEPGRADVALLLASVLSAGGKHLEAATTLAPFAAAIGADRKLIEKTADYYEAAGTWDKAVQLLAEASKADPRLLGRTVELAVAHPGEGLETDALVSLADSLHTGSGGSLETLLLLADALIANKETDKARQVLVAAKKTFGRDQAFKAKLKGLK
jgi:thioredoxin-like negative regulator of GroEL